jgi:hypothetical protein
MFEDAAILTKQLVSGLALFTGPARIANSVISGLKESRAAIDPEWIELISQRNYEWFIQLVRDVVEYRALRAVQTAIDHSEEVRLAALQQRRGHPIPPSLLPSKKGWRPRSRRSVQTSHSRSRHSRSSICNRRTSK